MKPARRHIWLRRALEILLFIALIVGVRAWQQRDIPHGDAPPLIATTLDGAAFDLRANDNQPTLVHFWASWCAICRLEQNSIDDLAKSARVITLAMQSGTTEEVSRHLSAHQLSFPVINDPDGHIATQWGVHAVPATFIVDSSGRIRFVEIGYSTSLGLQLRLWGARL